MKNTAKQYAKTLYDLTNDADTSRIDLVLGNFVKVLQKNGQLKMKNAIIEKFTDIHNQENGILTGKLIFSREPNTELVAAVESAIREKYAAKEVILSKRIDEKIKGGVIVKIGDEVFDASITGQLKALGMQLKNE